MPDVIVVSSHLSPSVTADAILRHHDGRCELSAGGKVRPDLLRLVPDDVRSVISVSQARPLPPRRSPSSAARNRSAAGSAADRGLNEVLK